MNEYLFVLGRTPKLAVLELQTFFPSVTLLSDHVATVAYEISDHDIDALGGTIKIAQVLTRGSSLDVDTVSQLLMAEAPGAVVFGMSYVEGEQPVPTKFLANVKERLQQNGRQARFIAAQHGASLSSVVVAKQQLVELVVVETSDGILIAKTIAVQNADEWNRRDYGRPFADPKAGMLPPKVARMAVNIAGTGGTLLDPFCGMGTILAEGMLAGWNVVGSDASKETVEKAQKNLEWLKRGADFNLFVSDATHVSEHLAPGSIDVIVTEPFMGSTRLGGNNDQPHQLQTVKNTIKGLEKLYLGCLKDWHRVLKPGARVVMAIPGFQIGAKFMVVKNVVDRCENLGYTKLAGPIEYSRPQAIVKREFYIFQKVNS